MDEVALLSKRRTYTLIGSPQCRLLTKGMEQAKNEYISPSKSDAQICMDPRGLNKEYALKGWLTNKEQLDELATDIVVRRPQRT